MQFFQFKALEHVFKWIKINKNGMAETKVDVKSRKNEI